LKVSFYKFIDSIPELLAKCLHLTGFCIKTRPLFSSHIDWSP